MGFVYCICVVMILWHWRGIQGVGLVPGAPCFIPNISTGCIAPHEQQNGMKIQYGFRDFQYGVTPFQNTLFFLFTRRNRINPEFLHHCGSGLSHMTNFNPDDKTEIFIHGHRDGSCRRAWMREMKDRLLFRGSYNVILVDWTWGNSGERSESVVTSEQVGTDVAILIRNIMKKTGVGPENFHLVGHSIGAHISGFVGQKVHYLRRITGLDPSYDPFHNRPPNGRLDVSDAVFVDIIHTNGGNGSSNTIGDFSPMGDADFYPNGGSEQPGCFPYIQEIPLERGYLYSNCNVTSSNCNHLKSIQYYKASINPCRCKFIGVNCDDYSSFASGKCRSCGENGVNCAVMGLDWEHYWKRCGRKQSTSVYYLKTKVASPYCDNAGLDHRGFSTRDGYDEFKCYLPSPKDIYPLVKMC